MNVLHIMDYAAPYKGNFIPSIQNLEDHLNSKLARLIYMFPLSAQRMYWVEELKEEGEKVYFIDNSFFSKKIKYSNLLKLKNVIKNENVEIIHTHFMTYNYSLALMKRSLIPKVKIVGNFMNEFLPAKNIYYQLKVLTTKLTYDIIIASSASVKKSVLKTGVTAKKVVTICNAIDFKHLQSFEKLNLKDNEGQKIILMFGWTFHRKGVDIAVKAVSGLIEEKRNIKLVIAMAGGQEIVKNEIIMLLGNMPKWINLLGPNPNVATYYNSADIFLSSSREEGFTYSVLEAAYCNPMIIVSKIGGHPVDIPNIGVFETERSDKLKEAINEMLKKSSNEISEINHSQREYVTKTYDINEWSKEVIKVYSIV